MSRFIPLRRVAFVALAIVSAASAPAAQAGEAVADVKPAAVAGHDSSTVKFELDVLPILTKAGCNSGPCHGKSRGQNGFQLSLLGFDPEFDYNSLVKDARGRRLFPAAPDNSLLLRKAAPSTKRSAAGSNKACREPRKTTRSWCAFRSRRPNT